MFLQLWPPVCQHGERGGGGESWDSGMWSLEAHLPDGEGGPEGTCAPEETLTSWAPALLPAWQEWPVVRWGKHLRTRLLAPGEMKLASDICPHNPSLSPRFYVRGFLKGTGVLRRAGVQSCRQRSQAPDRRGELQEPLCRTRAPHGCTCQRAPPPAAVLCGEGTGREPPWETSQNQGRVMGLRWGCGLGHKPKKGLNF